jgi:hypothetical protein
MVKFFCILFLERTVTKLRDKAKFAQGKLAVANARADVAGDRR